MAHDLKSLPFVRKAFIKAFEAHLKGYLDDASAAHNGLTLPEPTEYRASPLLTRPRGQAPIVSIFALQQTKVKGCAPKELKWDTQIGFQLLLTRDVIGPGDDPELFVDAFEEYADALMNCLFKDVYDSETAFLSAAGVEFLLSASTWFNPVNFGIDSTTSPQIRVGQASVLIRRYNRSY